MSSRILLRLAAVAAVACTLARVGPAAAGDQALVEPRAAEILNAAMTYLAGASSLMLRAEVVGESTLPSGQKLQHPGTLEVSLRRPDRLWYRLDTEQRRITAWYDGKAFTLLDEDKNTCATMPAPASIGQLFDEMAAKLGFRPPLAVLLREDGAAALARRNVSGFYVGPGRVDGTACHHLAFRQESVDVQYWVAEKGDPVIKRVVVTRKKQPGVTQSSYTIVSWTPNPALGDEVFAFKPPKNVVYCEFQRLVTSPRDER